MSRNRHSSNIPRKPRKPEHPMHQQPIPVDVPLIGGQRIPPAQPCQYSQQNIRFQTNNPAQPFFLPAVDTDPYNRPVHVNLARVGGLDDILDTARLFFARSGYAGDCSTGNAELVKQTMLACIQQARDLHALYYASLELQKPLEKRDFSPLIQE